MNLAPFGFDKRREVVVIVGAGATRGASFVDTIDLAKPPLDADFFRILRRTNFGNKHLDDARDKLLEFVADEFGSFDIGMETFYSQVFLHDKFVGEIPTGKKGRVKRYQSSLRRFEEVLPALLGRSLDGQDCWYHEQLVRAADATDVFISFNYDCLLDRALVKGGQRNWDPAKGYGFPIARGLTEWKRHDGRGRFPLKGMRLLKPHGSLNWIVNAGAIELSPSPYVTRAELKIVPPLWQKDFDEEPYPAVWSLARRALASVKALVVIGYSLPETDSYTQAMLRLDVGPLEFLGIVNPDSAAKRRIVGALRSSIKPSTHIVEIRNMQDLARMIVK